MVGFFISIFILYFTILHDTFINIHLRGIFIDIFAKDFKLQLLQYGPPLFLKVGVHFCSPQREEDTPEYLVSPRRQHSIFNLNLKVLSSEMDPAEIRLIR